MNKVYIRGSLLHCLAEPQAENNHIEFIEDGLLIIENGLIVKYGPWQTLSAKLPEHINIIHYKNSWLVPGFIDTHVHFPQINCIASYGEQLLTWLNRYIFPHEQKLQDPLYAQELAKIFIQELLRHGTTTAMVFATQYDTSVDAIFSVAMQHNMRLISGKVLMDCNVPQYLCEDTVTTYVKSKNLIKKWHGKKNTRLAYAITPRFALSASPELLKVTQKLKQEFPEVYVQTHLSENEEEIKQVCELHQTENYLDVYEQYQLLGKKSIFAHAIHLQDSEWQRLAKTQSSISFCPSSNLFLGSGLLNYAKAQQHKIDVGLGTDIGAGTSLSLCQTYNNAYKVLQLQRQNLSPWQGFYLITLGGAKALSLENCLGNFLPGKEADFLVLDAKGATPLLQHRLACANTLEEKLFVLMMLGDERSVCQTYVAGKLCKL